VSKVEDFIPVKRPYPRGFAHTLLLGGLFVIAAMMAQNIDKMQMRSAAVSRPVLPLPVNQPVRLNVPAYAYERSLSANQLLNRWDAQITEASQRFDVPKSWIRAVMRQESGGRTMLGHDRPIVSRAGAIGLMQVMPATYEEMAARHRLGADPSNARDNILAGTAYLRWLHQRYGYPRMFAAYNAGPGRVERGGPLPDETRAYTAGIAKTLRGAPVDLVKLTRPNGAAVKIDVHTVTGIRAALPGEYPESVKAVVTVAGKPQAVRENVAVAINVIRATGGLL
jgi:soluble lytic murein transglycosylase-like protein